MALSLAFALCFISYGCLQSSRTSVETDVEDEAVVAAKKVISDGVKAENEQCPIDFHNGLVYASATYDEENNEINYNYSTTSFTMFEKGESELKEFMLGTLVVACDNPQTKTFLEAVVKARTKQIYTYKMDGQTRKIIILPSDLESNIPQLQR